MKKAIKKIINKKIIKNILMKNTKNQPSIKKTIRRL